MMLWAITLDFLTFLATTKGNNMDLQMTSVYVGNTLLDVDFYMIDSEDDIGYEGDIEIEDVRIANTDISVLEMIHSLNWDKFEQQVWESV